MCVVLGAEGMNESDSGVLLDLLLLWFVCVIAEEEWQGVDWNSVQ